MKKEVILGKLFNLKEMVSRFASFSSQNSAICNNDIAAALKINNALNENSITEKFNNKKIIENNTTSALGQLFNFKVLPVLLVSLLLLVAPVLAIKQLISLQGKVDFNGVLVDNGNLTVRFS